MHAKSKQSDQQTQSSRNLYPDLNILKTVGATSPFTDKKKKKETARGIQQKQQKETAPHDQDPTLIMRASEMASTRNLMWHAYQLGSKWLICISKCSC
mmetsp:Transcript_98471/g.153881  ORF Transcript_98471/g.153881 Transcript_98471/m.153881 type:complete len:98 (+) Transcript_98471:100-393(+)